VSGGEAIKPKSFAVNVKALAIIQKDTFLQLWNTASKVKMKQAF